MYDAEITERRLFQAEQRLGFKLTRYEPGDSIDRAAAISKKYDARAGRIKNPLTRDEYQFIRNEQTFCRHDYLYYTRYCTIISKESGKIAYRPYKAQLILNDVRAEHEKRGIAMEFNNLKARQLGVSTDSEMVVSHRCQFGSYLYALVASADPKKSKTMSEMMIRNWQHMPFFLMPTTTNLRRGQEIQFGFQDVTIAIEWLNQISGLARGQTPTVAHISEVSMCDDPEQKIDASLRRAMHPSSKLYAMYESTAAGSDNWYHNTWKECVKLWPKGRSRLRPVFLPWFVGDDKYPTPAWLRTQPIPTDWRPHELTIRHAKRAAAYVAREPLLRKHLGLGWEMPKEQMWFWENERESHRIKRTLNVFYQEMPASADEAFQLALTSVFDAEQIAIFHEHMNEPIHVWGLRASVDVIPARNQVEDYEVDKQKEPRTLKCPNGQQFDMVPLKYEGDMTEPNGKIFVWEEKKKGATYGVGADCGWGVNDNRSCLEVMRKAAIGRPPGLIAEFAHDGIGASDMIPFAYAMGVLYSQTEDGYLKLPKFAIDISTNGEILQKALIRMGMNNIHVWQQYDRYGQQQTANPRLGVLPVQWFRSLSIEMLIKGLRDYLIEVDSIWFIREMGTIGYDKDRMKIEANEGSFDDRFMAAAYIYLSLHIHDSAPLQPTFGLRKIEPEQTPEQRYAAFPGYENEISAPLNPDYLAYMQRFSGGAPPQAADSGGGRVSYVETTRPKS